MFPYTDSIKNVVDMFPLMQGYKIGQRHQFHLLVPCGVRGIDVWILYPLMKAIATTFCSWLKNIVCNLVGNKKLPSLLLSLSKKGYVKKIRNNLYTCVNLADGQVIASKYHIACVINETACISHHDVQFFISENRIYTGIL